MIPSMARRLVPLALLTLSCAAPSELARRGDVALQAGDPERAFELAVKALDREPGNARAKATAAAAVRAITDGRVRRIRAAAGADTLAAAGEVLELAAFRARAARYAPVGPDSAWAAEERTLRTSAARVHYDRGRAALEAARPKRAYDGFLEAERFVPGYRDVAKQSQKAYDRAVTRVAFLPLRATSSYAGLGREVTDAWRDAVAGRLEGRHARFTRVLPGGEVERFMTVAEAGRLSREDAVRLGRRAGARWVVWGAIGGVEADTRTDRFDDVVLRRVTEKDEQKRDVVRWVDVPIEVVARQRSVRVEVEYEVLSVDEEATLARGHAEPALTARTLWTSFRPEGDLDDYALVSDPVRHSDPDRVRRVETRWKSVAGERQSVKSVLKGVSSARGRPDYRRDQLPRFYPDASGPVFLAGLPPAEDLAFAALAHAWEPLLDDLVRMDGVDDPDLVPVESREE